LFTSFPLSYIFIIPRLHEKSTGNIAQILGLNIIYFCTNLLLTKCAGCGIIKNSARIDSARAAKRKESAVAADSKYFYSVLDFS